MRDKIYVTRVNLYLRKRNIAGLELSVHVRV